MSTHYCAAYAEGKCFTTCFHQHQTVHSAAACIEQAGSYVVAVENGSIRSLTKAEEKEFRTAIYGDSSKPEETLSDKILMFRQPAWYKK